MTKTCQGAPTTRTPHFATLLLMALAPQEVGRRIAKRRKELGWTHERLASEMNVQLRTVQRWQEGQLPRLAKLMELAEVMGVERSYFVEEQEEERPLADRLGELEETVAHGFEAVEAAIERLAERLPRQGESGR